MDWLSDFDKRIKYEYGIQSYNTHDKCCSQIGVCSRVVMDIIVKYWIGITDWI